MLQIENYMEKLLEQLKEEYKERLLFLGLQGSYSRKEAKESSDIDIMAILDRLTIEDMKAYRKIIKRMGDADKSCGFICGKEELRNWNTCEICQLLHETKAYYGRLEDFVPEYTIGDIRQHIKISVGNLYHEICHRYIHSACEQDAESLKGSYKQVFYILQNLHYLRTGVYIHTKRELLSLLPPQDHAVLSMAVRISAGEEYTFDQAFPLLFHWCQEILQIGC